MDSDTESESQELVEGWDGTELAHIATTQTLCASQNSSQDVAPSSTDVGHAIQDLRSLDLEVVEKDESLHDVIQVASAAILSCLEHAVAASAFERRDIHDIEHSISALLNPEFVALLFAYRRIFHAIAARNVHAGTVSSAAVCWVDVVFAKLGEAVTAVAPGMDAPSYAGQSDPIHASIQKQFDCHLLRAATQLPSTSSALPSVLSVAHASPAACRLALRLLYGIYILRPHLRGVKALQAASVDREKLYAALRSYLSRAQAPTPHTTSIPCLINGDEFGLQARVTYAMFLSLFAAVESSFTGEDQSIFRPSTEAALLRHVIVIMCPTTVLSSDAELMTPSPSLDTAQLILLRCPDTIGWCWKLWSDQRVAHAEVVDYLTANWLYHLDDPITPDSMDHDMHWDERVLTAVEGGPSIACATLTRFINRGLRIMSNQQTSSVILDVVHKAVYACVAYLLSDYTQHESGLITELCISLGRLFFHISRDDAADIIKDVILDGLSLVRIDTLRTATEKIFGYGSDLRVQLERNISEHASSIADVSGRKHLEDTDVSLRQLLHYLTLICHSRAELHAFGEIMAPLLRNLVEWLSTEKDCHDNLTTLRSACTLLLCVSCVDESCGPSKVWVDKAVWEIALVDEDPGTLVRASAFSAYICATHHQNDGLSAVTYADGWDFLRDTLLLILNHHFLDAEEPLALLVAPSICVALLYLMLSAEDRTTDYIFSSPWTMNLCIALKGIGQSAEWDDKDVYFHHLRRRIAAFATPLLTEIRNNLSTEESMPTNTPTDIISQSDLISVRVHGISQLLLVYVA